MTPQQLLDRTPKKVVKLGEDGFNSEVFFGIYYCHVPELEDLHYYQRELKSDRITIHVYCDYWGDFRRFWRLLAIFLDNKPVMITQNAGREGDDHRKRFILNRFLYSEMVQHLMTVMNIEAKQIDTFAMDQDIPGLTEFYGYTCEL